MHWVNRKNKRGGGTALFVKDDLHQSFANEFSYSTENGFDCVVVDLRESNVYKLMYHDYIVLHMYASIDILKIV